MRPVHLCHVAPFLVLKTPATANLVTGLVTLDPTVEHLIVGQDGDSPIYLTRAEAETVCHKMMANILTEAQWEYACRAGRQRLFPWGNEILDDPALASWMKLVFANVQDITTNGYGLAGLGVGEWCQDRWRRTYKSKPGPGEVYAVRGGAALFWPWQDEGEWGLAVCASRMPSTDTFNGMAAVRPARSIVSC